MIALLKLALFIYLCVLCLGAFLAVIRFFLDVAKWHDKEDKVHITASDFEADLLESEVSIDERRDNNISRVPGRQPERDNHNNDNDNSVDFYG